MRTDRPATPTTTTTATTPAPRQGRRRLPSVDVVVAVRADPGQARTAVASVLAQDYAGRIRCLVVHDRDHRPGGGPGDPGGLDGLGGLEGLDGRAPGRSVEVLANTRSPGSAGARNTGILAGGGDLVAFCDQADVWFEDKVTRQVAVLERTGAAASVTGVVVDHRDHRTTRIPRPDELTVHRLARRPTAAGHVPTVMVRRSRLLDDIGLLDEELPGGYAEDYDWLLRAATVDRFAVVEMGLVLARPRPLGPQWPAAVAAIDRLIAKHAAFAEDPRALGRLHGQRAVALAASGQHGALVAAARALRTWPWDPSGYVAGAVALHLLSVDAVVERADRRGRVG
ncbi:glycosyltransferase family A protein [Nocardioides sp. Arc9.136]|uniref:glycosyltransferase family 2 protein n=1 Tax=Nocardioides sp. Arc9.136 TaxID=2996826 RepID=UPI0026651DF0|nr:glycosyltransferase family A protein [Nocardioides sp. Arc9.136]WKN46989.1 glycosyltransferase family A protein [Nocardioides sp. Arc9.136]